ncbi:hypothetical protein [Hymenobacter koreensis]|uniref:DUF4369 domain-containing protein n=1 Tax=Hymenobacter koreensis TaxID=1084523 RepID=A0ABP8ITI8_9BACT
MAGSVPALLIGLLALSLAACDPVATFEPYSVKHPLNLERVLGRRVTLLGPDTLALAISFDPATRQNLIVSSDSSRQPLSVWATRYRGLYYLTQSTQHDSVYLVHAVRISSSQVQGLYHDYNQLTKLAEAVNDGQYQDLISFQDNKKEVLRLRYHAKTLRPFYEAVLDSLPVYRVQAGARSTSKTPVPAAGPIQSVYPNPARQQTTRSARPGRTPWNCLP